MKKIMRCKNCRYWHHPQYESDDDCCSIFGYCDGYIDENSKGEQGCRYNRIQLKRMFEKEMKELVENG